MKKNEFKLFCEKEFEARGFKKSKKMFYLSGHDVLCGIDLQKSNYGSIYYVNFYFFLGDFRNEKQYPVCYDLDVQGRISVVSKAQTVQGKPFTTAMLEYEKYTADELHLYFDKEFEERILPPIHQGKKYILDNLGKLYSLTLRKEEVMQKLQA